MLESSNLIRYKRYRRKTAFFVAVKSWITARPSLTVHRSTELRRHLNHYHTLVRLSVGSLNGVTYQYKSRDSLELDRLASDHIFGGPLRRLSILRELFYPPNGDSGLMAVPLAARV